MLYHKSIFLTAMLVFALSIICLCADSHVTLIDNKIFESFSSIAQSSIMKISKERVWEKIVPEVTTITIKSTADGTKQKALYYDSQSPRDKPLLLALHSWSADYQQHFSIPYGMWAVKNDWVFIHPNYRGAFTNPKATASELAIQDILDALRYAKSHARIDSTRIYITGFSGGGMVTLIMVGRYPDLWAGAVAWVPVYDLVLWYQTTKQAKHGYARHIVNSCGGAPLPNTSAQKECKKRSVSSYLKNAKGKKVTVYIAAGIDDQFVPPGHSILAYNDLADEADRISPKDIEHIDTYHSLPQHLTDTYADSFYTDAGMPLLSEIKSSNVVLKIFNGGHDVLYNEGLFWLNDQSK